MAPKRKLSLAAITAICAHIQEGLSVQAALVAEGWKSVRAFYAFIKQHHKAQAVYRNALEIRAEHWAEELVEIADSTEEDVQRSKLRVDARKWIISKHLPKVYGDKVQVESTVDGTVKHEHDLSSRSLEILSKLTGGAQ